MNHHTTKIIPTGAERQTYFGCWLDINQLQPLFPIYPNPSNGPFPTDRKTIQELIRSQHQCIVAEIAFDLAPIANGNTPGQSDKLAQRNLAIVASANPGDIASHRIPLTFEIKPTSARLESQEMPDELMIDWGNTPDDSTASFYIPGISSSVVLDMADKMYKTHRLNRVDDHTLKCRTQGITYIPIPPGVGANLAGLITVDLPETVERKQRFTIVARQVTNTERYTVGSDNGPEAVTRTGERTIKWRKVLGSFQLTIPIQKKEMMLEPERRLLSVLRWIQKAIPDDNRWSPVFLRYVGQIANRVDALGGNSTEVAPSPNGEWRDSKARFCNRFALATGALLAICIVLSGILNIGLLVPIGIPVLALLAVVGLIWIVKCHPKACRLIWRIITGVGIGAVVLILMAWLRIIAPQFITVLAISVVIIIIVALAGLVRRCW